MSSTRLKKRVQSIISGKSRRTGSEDNPSQIIPSPAGPDDLSLPSRSSPAPVPFPDGVKELHTCPDATIDICFVHGLTGNRDSTWTAESQSEPWPATLLPQKLPRARILTYGYDAYVLRTSVASSNGLLDHAKNLLSDLAANRTSAAATSRPLLFVAHSLGGIVCKEAILLSQNNPDAHLRDVFASTRGVAFMGTPHRGSWMARWAEIPASRLGLVAPTNTRLLRLLRADDAYLESIQDRFSAMLRGRQAPAVTCFFEELPLPVVGKVVAKESATLDGYEAHSIHANHRDMVRFASEEERGFVSLVAELRRWEQQARTGTAVADSEPSAQSQQKGAEHPSRVSYVSRDGGPQYNNSVGGTQNINHGSGKQFVGGTFNGTVNF